MMKYRMITKVLASTLSIMLIVLATPHAVTAVSSEKPRLNYFKKILCVKSSYNQKCSFKLKLKGTNKKAKFTSLNRKVACVSSGGKVVAVKPGKTTIIAEVSGHKLKCRVTVKPLSTFAKLIRNKTIKVRYRIKKNRTLNINVGQRSKFKNYEDMTCAGNYYYESDNIYKLYLKGKLTNRQKNKYMGIVEKYVKYKSSKPSVAKVTKSGRIIPKKAGKAIVSVRLINKTFKIKVNVTRKHITTYKGQKSLAVYSDRDVYNALKDAFYNHLIKGEKPEYKYLTCYYEVKPGNRKKKGTLSYNLVKYALSEMNTGNNFYAYVCGGFFTSELFSINDGDDCNSNEELSNTVITVGLNSGILEYVKLTYIEAEKIFRDYGINEMTNDYDKIKAMHLWFYDNTTYGAAYSDIPEYSILVNHEGVCTAYSFGTLYLCTLLGIPCDTVISDDHMWNICRIQCKWYYLDELHYVVLLGENGMPNDEMYKPRDIVNLIGKIHVSEDDYVFLDDVEPVTDPQTEFQE